MRQEE